MEWYIFNYQIMISVYEKIVMNKIKLLSSAFCILLLTLNSHAQKFSFGPEVGMQTMTANKVLDKRHYTIGPRIGLRVDYRFLNFLSVSSGVAYKTAFSSTTDIYVTDLAEEAPILGLLLNGAGDLGDLTNINNRAIQTVDMSYVEIPLLANVNCKNIYLTVGPQFSFLLNASQQTEITKDIPLQTILDSGLLDQGMGGGFDLSELLPPTFEMNSGDYKNEVNGFDIGYIVGLGYQVKALHFNAQYSRSLNDYRKNNAGKKTVHTAFRFSTAYLFNLDIFKFKREPVQM